MLTHEQKEGLVAGAKLGSVWAAVGITSWADFAAVLAALYSGMLIVEFLWKKLVKPMCQRYGLFGYGRR